MLEENVKRTRETTHDFLVDRRWLTILSGFAEYDSVLYTVYRSLIILTMIYMQAMAVIACLIEPTKKKIVEAVHFMLLSIFITFWFFAVRLGIYKSLEETRAFLNSGVYCYEDEESDEEIMKMKEEMPLEIRRKSNIFVYMFILGGLTNTTLFPLSQLAVLDTNRDFGATNPFLPHLFYQPFSTRTAPGLAAGYVLGISIYFVMYIISCATNWYYISGVVQMKLHFRVLNYSIANLQRRAVAMYAKKLNFSVGFHFNADKLLSDGVFQDCLYACFRANVQHHQALLRLRKIFEPLSGSFALAIFSLSSMVYGCQLYLMYQGNAVNVTINLFLAFAAEQFTVIFICFLGEDVLQESEKVFHQLYDISWFNYSKKLKQILHIAMSNTIKPTGVKALLFGVPASFETYTHDMHLVNKHDGQAKVISAMYKVMNLVRQSDIM